MKYFIDCGGHHGEGLKHFIDEYKIDDTWVVFSFEPNIESFKILSNGEYTIKKIKFMDKCISIKNGKMTFYPETTSESYGSKNDGAGSTLIPKKDWNIKNNGNWGAGEFKTEYEVEAIDFSDFINSLEDIEFLLVKMDVEGAEYGILRKLIDDDTIVKINDIHIEFHDWAMASETEESTNELIKTITNKGVKFKRWW